MTNVGGKPPFTGGNLNFETEKVLKEEVPPSPGAKILLEQDSKVDVSRPTIKAKKILPSASMLQIILNFFGFEDKSVKNLPLSQLHSLDLEDLKELSKRLGGKLPPYYLVRLSKDQVNLILDHQPKLNLAPKTLDLLTKMRMSSEEISKIPFELIPQLNIEQQAALLAESNIPHLTAPQLEKFNFSGICQFVGKERFINLLINLSPQQLQHLNVPEIANILGTEDFKIFLYQTTNDQFDVLNSSGDSHHSFFNRFQNLPSWPLSDIQSTSPETFRLLYSSTVAQFKAEALDILNPDQINALGRAGKLKWINVEELKKIRPEQAALFNSTSLQSLTEEQRQIILDKARSFLQSRKREPKILEQINNNVHLVSMNADEIDLRCLKRVDRNSPFFQVPLNGTLVQDAMVSLIPKVAFSAVKIPDKVSPSMDTLGLNEGDRTFDKKSDPIISTNTLDNHYASAFTSTFTLNKEGLRHEDPIIDNTLFREFTLEDGRKVYLLSSSAGMSRGPNEMEAVLQANEGYISQAEEDLKDGVSNTQEFAQIPFRSTEKAAQNVLSKGNGKVVQAGATIIETEKGIFYGTGSSVGDMSAYLINQDGVMIELTQAKNIREPPYIGGQDGVIYSNFAQFNFKAKTGDTYIVMSDGVRDNLKPYNNEMTPQQTLEILENARFPLVSPMEPRKSLFTSDELEKLRTMDTLDDWTSKRNILKRLDDAYLNYLFLVEFRQGDKNQSLSEKAIHYVRSKPVVHADHCSCVQITL